MKARKCAYPQKPYSFQAFANRLMGKKAAQQNKNLSEELKQCLSAQLSLTMMGGTPNFPSTFPATLIKETLNN